MKLCTPTPFALFAVTALALSLISSLGADAEIVEREVPYTHDDVQLKGVLFLPAEVDGKVPGVLVVHEWWGLNDYAKKRAKMLAELGYAAFAVDMYGLDEEGNNLTTDDPKQAGEWAGALYGDRELHRARVAAGLAAFIEQPEVDGENVAAMGYCFGGTTVIELAYAGADITAAFSFHGNPKPPAEGEAEAMTARLVVYHGARDSLVPTESLIKALTPVEQAGKDWELIVYSGAKHAFSNPAADGYGLDPVGYDKTADERSWEHLVAYLAQLMDAIEQEPLVLTIDSEGNVLGLEGDDPAERARNIDVNRPVHLVVSEDAPFESVVNLMNGLKAIGVKDIAVITKAED